MSKIDNNDLKIHLKNQFLLKLNGIRNDTNEASSVDKLISLLHLINDILTETTAHDSNQYEPKQIKREFCLNFYYSILNEILLNFLNKKWFYTSLNQKKYFEIRVKLIGIVLVTNYQDTFKILTNVLFNEKQIQHEQRDLCLELVKQYVNKRLLLKLFEEKCETRSNKPDTSDDEWLINAVISLPDRLTNVFVTNLSSIFYPNTYYKILISDLNSSLKFVFDSITKSQDVSIDFTSNIFGKLCLLGHSDLISKIILNSLYKNCRYNPIWMRISQKLIQTIPYKYLEHSLYAIFIYAKNYRDVSFVLGDTILTNSNIKFIITDKFLFLKIFSKETIIQNIIGYLCDSVSRKDIYLNIFKDLITTWSMQQSIVNTSYEQHLYLTKCIIVCLAFLDNNDDKLFISNEVMGTLLKGVQQHISSPIDRMRVLGMIIGEYLMNELNLDINKENLLKFDYDQTDETKLLHSLRVKPVIVDKNEDELNLEDLRINQNGEDVKVLVENKRLKIIQSKHDSDDDDEDLMAYDLSNDVQINKDKQPVYLRNCLDSLIYSDDCEKIELSMKSIESLCSSYHFELNEICVELAKVLLHKANNFSIENFEELRLKGLVAITVHYPIEVSGYLTQQFYERNYTITQRMDILHILAIAAQKLSDPNEEPVYDKREQKQQITDSSSNLVAMTSVESDRTSNWKEIVQKRIESKTRIISKGSKNRQPIKMKENKYSQIVGHFFFPLLKPYDENRIYLKILDDDFMLLGKLIYTLAILIYSAINTSIIENMMKSMLDFIWSLRTHKEPYIRKSLLFAYTIVLSVSANNKISFSEFFNYIFELKTWLENIAIDDPDVDCQRQAIECIGLFNEFLKNQLLQMPLE